MSRANASLKAQEFFNPFLIKTYHRLTVDQCDRRALVAHGKEFFKRRLILTHVLIDESNSLLRKKLFLPIAGPSARLAEDNDRFSHLALLS